MWNKEDPCVIAGFDMEPLGAAQALASQPPGAVVCCFSLEQPVSLVLTCKRRPSESSKTQGRTASPNRGSAESGEAAGSGDSGAGPAGDACDAQDGLLQAVVQIDDLLERRLETWLRDLQDVTHVLDVYRNKLQDKRVLLGLNNFTRLRAMDPLDAFDDVVE